MTAYLATLTVLFSSILLFSAKTEHSRIVTIQRPIVITQERKTPAFFAYQQSQALTQKKATETTTTNSTYLSNFSVRPPAQVHVAEIKFTKKEYAQLVQNNYRPRSVASELTQDVTHLAYEKVVFNPNVDSPLLEQPQDVPELSPSKKWATIRGHFELRDGVGIVDHIIDVKRVEEGLVREQGRIDLAAGSYSIDIESPNGFLIAQVRDRSGLIIGEDRQPLIKLQNKGSYFEGPFIRVGRPDTLAANPAVRPSTTRKSAVDAATNFAKVNYKISTQSGLSASIFSNQKMLGSPYDEFTNISKYSSTISRIYDPSGVYANIVSVRMTGDKTETDMFTSKWVDGAVSYVSDLQQVQFKSAHIPVLIGKVLIDGKAAAGAQAHIEGFPSIKAVYFDQFMIPSLSMNETSSNGYFMFIGVEPNAYNVAVFKQNIIIGSQIFVAENDNVSFQNINSTAVPRNKLIRSFDAFNSDSLDIEVISGESDQALQTSAGVLNLRTYVQSNVVEYLADAHDERYLPMRYVQNGKQDYAHLPMIPAAWFNEIKRIQQLNELPNTGVILGFTSDLNYEAYLAVESFDKNNIVYFSKSGQLTQAPEMGGGFIIFNVPTGAKEVVLQDIATERIYSQVFNIRDGQISVSHFRDQ